MMPSLEPVTTVSSSTFTSASIDSGWPDRKGSEGTSTGPEIRLQPTTGRDDGP